MRLRTSRLVVAAATIAALGVSVASCSSVRRAVGAERVRPDEFRIVTMAPLEVPPEYNLRPPRPGEPRPQEYAASDSARAALYGEGDEAAGVSQGQRLLVERSGGTLADPNIRAVVDAEAAGIIRRRRGFANRVMFWTDGDTADEANPLNAVSEAERLEREEAARRATGDGDVVIRRAGGGLKLPGL